MTARIVECPKGEPPVQAGPVTAEQCRALANQLNRFADELDEPSDEGEFLVLLVDPASGDSTVACTCSTREEAEKDAADWAQGTGLLSFVICE